MNLMSAIKSGRVCIITAGRDAGKKCIIVSPKSDSMLNVKVGSKARTISIRHIEPTMDAVTQKE